MINTENLEKLYRGLIENRELTTKELNSYGFNSRDLARLIEEGKLKRIKRGLYEFLDIESLYLYGKKINWRDHCTAHRCFHRCRELDNSHGGANFQLFIASIRARDYTSAFEYFDAFYENDRRFYRNDSNFYLYLLSHITTVPEKYVSLLNTLSIESIQVSKEDKRYADPSLENKIRINALHKKFVYALQLLNDKRRNGHYRIQDSVTRELLFLAIGKEKEFKSELLELASNKRYAELKDAYRLRSRLNDFEKYALKLVEAILEIESTNTVPPRFQASSSNLYELIDTGNFDLALKLNTEYYISKGLNPKDNILNVLLNSLCGMIKEIEASKKEEVFDTSTLIKMFFDSLKRNAFDDARKYLNAILEEEHKNSKPGMARNLQNLLKDAQGIIDEKKSRPVDTFEQENKPFSSQTDEEVVSDENIQRDIEYIEQTYQKIIQGESMVLLEATSKERCKRLLDISEYYPDIESYIVIDELGHNRLMMRYMSIDIQRFNYKEAFQLGREYYEREDYDRSIIEFKRLLQLREARAYTYAMLGLSYMRKQDLPRAIDFLTVATHLDKCEHRNTNYTDLIKRLKIKLAKENELLEEASEKIENYDVDIITAYILEFDLDVETACRNLGLRPDTALMVMMEYAKHYYSQNEYAKGDQFIRVVEKSTDKTEKIIKALSDIKRDKKFYAHRLDAKDDRLPYKIEPISPKSKSTS